MLNWRTLWVMMLATVLTACQLPDIGLAKNPSIAKADYDSAPYVLRVGILNLTKVPVTRTLKFRFVFLTNDIGKKVGNVTCGSGGKGSQCHHTVIRETSATVANVAPGYAGYVDVQIGGTAINEQCTRAFMGMVDCEGNAKVTLENGAKSDVQMITWRTQNLQPVIITVT